jgi:hypothetical protein
MIEMQCYCDIGHHSIRTSQCKNIIPYKNHHDWGCDEDFTCQTCLDECHEDIGS